MSELISNTSHAIQDAKVLYESLKRSSQKDEKIKNLALYTTKIDNSLK